MAKLSFIRGAAVGKMGEFVGAKWKGINYIRLYAKPANPRTDDQVSIRKVFKALSDFANTLFKNGLFEMIPPAPRMTERNIIFKANRQMLAEKSFKPQNLQIAKANGAFILNVPTCARAGAAFNYSIGITNNDEDEEATLTVLIYDHVKGVYVNHSGDYVLQGFATKTGTVAVPTNFGTTTGSQAADCRAYFVVYGVNNNGKKIISQTVSCAVTGG